MLDDEDIACIAAALTAVRGVDNATMPWTAINALAALGQRDIALTIDLRASAALGAPLLVAHPRGGVDLSSLLSAREADVASCIRRGLANKAIAQELGISLATVKDHVHNILSKSGCASRGELAARLTGAR